MTDVETLHQGKPCIFREVDPNECCLIARPLTHPLKSQLNRMQYWNICTEIIIEKKWKFSLQLTIQKEISILPSSYMPTWEPDNPTPQKPAKAKTEAVILFIVVTTCFSLPVHFCALLKALSPSDI